jgi:D-serine deaminase-like pyridoxal phosphate-dependent protein
MDKARLDALLDETIDHRFKGLSPATYGRTLREVAAQRPSLFAGSFSPPVMVLHESALTNNLSAMADFCAVRGVALAPHGKTTMAPQLFARQLDHGAWGMTVATIAQAAVCRAFGVRRILLANELVDPAAIEWVVDELRSDAEFEFFCYVDSVEAVERIAAVTARSPGRGVTVLIEIGFDGGRTGCRSSAHAIEVAAAAAAANGMQVVGVAGYEGGIGHDVTEEVRERVREFLQQMRETASTLLTRGLIKPGTDGLLLTAGGSVFFDDVAAVLAPPLPDATPVHALLRPGCYLTHDQQLYDERSPFTRPGADPRWRLQPAIEVWSQVLSVPEPGLALIGLGRRDVAFDAGLPVAQRLFRPATGVMQTPALPLSGLNDQHGYLPLPAGAQLAVGDWLGCGINHPCTQFDKWRMIAVVDDDYRVVDFVTTFF